MNNVKMGIIGGSSGAFLAETAKNMGLHTILILGNEKEKGAEFATESFCIDLRNEEEITNLLLEKCDVVLIGTGHKYAHAIAKRLYDKGLPISIEPYKAEYGKNKLLCYETLVKMGYLVPEHKIIYMQDEITEELIASIKLPCVVKSESDAVKTAKANNREELMTLINKNRKLNSTIILDQFITGLNVTIPVVANGEVVRPLKEALDMTDINKMAIDGCGNFDEEKDTLFDVRRDKMLTKELKEKIANACKDIIETLGIIGVPRFDIIVTEDGKIYFLEINEVAVSHFEATNFPYKQVGINMGVEMINVALDRLKTNNK